MTGENMAADDKSGLKSVSAIADEVRQEFLDEMAERLRELDVELDSAVRGDKTMDEFVNHARRLAMSLKGRAAAVGALQADTLARRMEDYLAQLPNPIPPRVVDDTRKFIETTLDAIEGRINNEADISTIVRRLPAKVGFSVNDITFRDVEVMLVMGHGAQTHYIERELQQCGYRTSLISSTFDAIPMVVRTKPDFVIVSAVMPDLSGIDIAIALSSMPETRNIPLALITSLPEDDAYLQLLPKKVPIINKGSSFGDDLFKALDSVFLI
jgi:CheY-like chemotaxis protein/HPt (histidine-containing phosphotransfer) domain-containing protein